MAALFYHARARLDSIDVVYVNFSVVFEGANCQHPVARVTNCMCMVVATILFRISLGVVLALLQIVFSIAQAYVCIAVDASCTGFDCAVPVDRRSHGRVSRQIGYCCSLKIASRTVGPFNHRQCLQLTMSGMSEMPGKSTGPMTC